MNYKDKSFEINEDQIKFKNKTLSTYPIIAISTLFAFLFFGYPQGLSYMLFSALGGVIGFGLAFGVFIKLYWKNTIDLAEIADVKVRVWDVSIDKDTNFWGIGNYRYHFPTGFNKKTNPKVLFIHRKEKNLAVGFVPENCENAISVFKEKGIKIIE